MINPYNQQVYEISLRPQDVQAFVFWSRNYKPFLEMGILDRLDTPFICHMSVTGYPRKLDQATIASDVAISQLIEISKKFGSKSVVWRYDPIVLTADMGADWHKENFARLAAALAGSVDEVIVSFVQFYRKTQRNFDRAGFKAFDVSDEEKQVLLLALHDLASQNAMKLTLCAQPDLLVGAVEPAACIDVHRLNEIAGRDLYVKKVPHRKECGCVSSKDIGEYNTCPHGCLYCYAVEKRDLAKQRFQNHDPNSPFLFKTESKIERSAVQGRLI